MFGELYCTTKASPVFGAPELYQRNYYENVLEV